MNSRQLTLGFSPCPNDTFIFHALVSRFFETGALQFAPEVLADVETLNSWALEGRLDVTKLSFHALGHVSDEYVLLTAGAALGRGCGPLVVARTPIPADELADKSIAIPGKLTTAAMLLRMWAPHCRNITVRRFDQIVEQVRSGEVDAGVIIHESRFTYQNAGLVLLQDLGSWWEGLANHPLPLGGIVARRSLGLDVLRQVDDCIRRSVRWAYAHPDDSASYVRRHAQELDEKVIQDHIDLYVNHFSENLGHDGLIAVHDFLLRGRAAGILPEIRRDFSLLAIR